MAWRPHGRASVDPSNPRAWGICDRCGFLYNLENLQFETEWAGNRIVKRNIRVCERCTDDLDEHSRPHILPPDGLPVDQPRWNNLNVSFAADETFDNENITFDNDQITMDSDAS